MKREDLPKGTIVIGGCSGASVLARRVLVDNAFEEVASVGLKDRFDFSNSLPVETALTSILSNDLLEKILKDFERAGIRGREAGEALRKAIENLQDAQKLTLAEPKCKKFHQNLRSKLNTGGIKWMK